MNIKLDQKIELNKWLISARWYYETAIFLIVFLVYLIESHSIYHQSFYLFSLFFGFFIVVNGASYFILKEIKKVNSEILLKFFSYFLIVSEFLFLFFTISTTDGNLLTGAFFLLPILSAIVILGVSGIVLTVLTSLFLINYLVVSQYSLNSSFGLTSSKSELVVFFGIFIIISFLVAKMVKFVANQDTILLKKAEELEKVSEYRKNEWMQLQKATNLLTVRDKEVTTKNEELDKKIKDLTRSEKSMLSVFSDLKKEREKTEKEKNKIEAIISNFIDPIILIDNLGQVNLFNPSAHEIFGFEKDILDKNVSVDGNFSMNNFKVFTKYDYRVKTSQELKSQDPTEEEVVIVHTGNELTYKVITVAVVDKNGNNLGVMKIFNNLTREKMLDKMKSDFISIAAHQLRTPLSAIKWAIKMVLDGDTGKLNEEQSGMLFKGYQSNERIIELVNDMLNVSRIEEGRFGYSFSEGDILKELDFVVDSLQGKIKEKNIKLSVIKPETVPSILMDQQKMTLVLQNLIENAIKYTPDRGSVDITMELAGDFLKTRVKDSGVGIPEEDKEKMFSKFFRASNVTRMQTEGSGLGLFIVKNIIKKHGGEISFDSKEGIGTEFVFSLPLKNN